MCPASIFRRRTCAWTPILFGGRPAESLADRVEVNGLARVHSVRQVFLLEFLVPTRAFDRLVLVPHLPWLDAYSDRGARVCYRLPLRRLFVLPFLDGVGDVVRVVLVPRRVRTVRTLPVFPSDLSWIADMDEA